MELWNFQQILFNKIKESLLKNKSVLVQLATGGGKTAIMSAICKAVVKKNNTAWLVVPRRDLILQSSNHLRKWGVRHGQIWGVSNESLAFDIHIVSKDTIIRRYSRIKKWPDVLIFDEAHIAIERQIEISSHIPDHSKIIGFTATPERLDGQGLWSGAGGLYDDIIEGPSIPWLTEAGYLTKLRYFYFSPLAGLDNLKKRGYDYDEESLDLLLKSQKVYGKLIDHYKKYGIGKAALIFCRSVKSSYDVAEKFKRAGFNFYCIEGKMTNRRRYDLIHALSSGDIDGLTNCEIATYGIDIPRVEYGASLRPTLSKALYFQMIGRLLRPFETAGYKKEAALFFDHVNLLIEHQDPDNPGVPPHFLDQINWNFTGKKKKKETKCIDCNYVYPHGDKIFCKIKGSYIDKIDRCKHYEKMSVLRGCPFLDYEYCAKKSCIGCKYNNDKIDDVRLQKKIITIDTWLEEKKPPVRYSEMQDSEKYNFQKKINAIITDYKKIESDGTDDYTKPVSEILQVAEGAGYNVMWCYYTLTDSGRLSINIPVLHEIARQKGYDPRWVRFKIIELRKRQRKKEKENYEYKKIMVD